MIANDEEKGERSQPVEPENNNLGGEGDDRVADSQTLPSANGEKQSLPLEVEATDAAHSSQYFSGGSKRI